MVTPGGIPTSYAKSRFVSPYHPLRGLAGRSAGLLIRAVVVRRGAGCVCSTPAGPRCPLSCVAASFGLLSTILSAAGRFCALFSCVLFSRFFCCVSPPFFPVHCCFLFHSYFSVPSCVSFLCVLSFWRSDAYAQVFHRSGFHCGSHGLSPFVALACLCGVILLGSTVYN